MSVLITGASGGLGLALVAAFRAAGRPVRATGRNPALAARLEALGAEYRIADLTQPGAAAALCDGQRSVVHAAALSASWGPAEDFHRINVEATERLLAAAQAAGCRRFVFVSSPSIYAAMRDRIGLTETDAPADPPLNLYARSKLAAERAVAAAHRPGFATLSLRPRAITGPDDRVLLPRLIELAALPRVPLLRGGRALVELTDVRDVASAVLAAEARAEALAGGAVNISGGHPLPIRRIAQEIGTALGRNIRFLPLPMTLARPIAALNARRPDTGPEPRLTPYTLATLAYSQSFDLSGARRLLDWQPQHDALASLLAGVRR